MTFLINKMWAEMTYCQAEAFKSQCTFWLISPTSHTPAGDSDGDVPGGGSSLHLCPGMWPGTAEFPEDKP